MKAQLTRLELHVTGSVLQITHSGRAAPIEGAALLQTIAPYLTIGTAILAAYFAFRNQLRLKSFELLYERRQSVLRDIEKQLGELYKIFRATDLTKSDDASKYESENFHESLVLFHKIKGVQFGETVDVLADTFLSVAHEPYSPGHTISEPEFRSLISRQANALSAIYGFAHKQLSLELDSMAFSWLSRRFRNKRKKTKSN